MIIRSADLPSRVVAECSTKENHLALPAMHQHPPKNACEEQNRASTSHQEHPCSSGQCCKGNANSSSKKVLHVAVKQQQCYITKCSTWDMKETQQASHLKKGNEGKKHNTHMNWINHEQS
jgi:hypothetical protein